MRGAVPSPWTNSRRGTSGKEQIGKKSAIARSLVGGGDLGFGAQQKLQRQLILLETQQETAGLLPDAALRIPFLVSKARNSRVASSTEPSVRSRLVKPRACLVRLAGGVMVNFNGIAKPSEPCRNGGELPREPPLNPPPSHKKRS